MESAERDKIIWEHGRRNFQLRANGVLCIVCPVTDSGDIKGIGIFNASVDETGRIMAGDPGVETGIFVYEVHLCRGFARRRFGEMKSNISRKTFIQKASVIAGGLSVLPDVLRSRLKSKGDIQEFSIHVPQMVLDDLKRRIVATRWPDSPDDAGWRYGTNLIYAKELATHWANAFDWRKQESFLNHFKQFQVVLDDCRVHFIYEKSKEANPLPLIISHGWPSSFVEMYKIIPMLTDPVRHNGTSSDAFDVIVPSLPGFAFSSPRKHGHMRAHELWVKLMRDVLGYDKFIAQGTDVGAGVTSRLGLHFPERLLGIHISGTDLLWPTPLPQPSQLSEAEKRYIANNEKWDKEENGYGHIQGTRPQTVAYGLNDSPVGLAAWITEKFRAWSDCNGNIESRFSKDELLTNITIYWATQTINSSMRHYFHAQNKVDSPPPLKLGERVEAPTGIAMFPGEKDLIVPREFAERCYNIRHWTDMPRGGHFAALEEPELLVKDIRSFARLFRETA